MLASLFTIALALSSFVLSNADTTVSFEYGWGLDGISCVDIPADQIECFKESWVAAYDELFANKANINVKDVTIFQYPCFSEEHLGGGWLGGGTGSGVCNVCPPPHLPDDDGGEFDFEQNPFQVNGEDLNEAVCAKVKANCNLLLKQATACKIAIGDETHAVSMN